MIFLSCAEAPGGGCASRLDDEAACGFIGFGVSGMQGFGLKGLVWRFGFRGLGLGVQGFGCVQGLRVTV